MTFVRPFIICVQVPKSTIESVDSEGKKKGNKRIIINIYGFWFEQLTNDQNHF